MTLRNLIRLVICLWGASVCAHGETPVTSTLWEQYVSAKQTGAEPTLADFSYVGYHSGALPIPDAKWPEFDVTQYGARPNDQQSDKAAILAAVAAAEAHGCGVITFPSGRFCINGDGEDLGQPIVVRSSRIVFRGSGSGAGGTELYMQHHMEAVDPDKMWTSPYMIQFRGRGHVGKRIAVAGDAGRETHRIEVEDTSSLQVGDWVVLRLLNASPEVVAAAVAPYTPEPRWTKLIEQGVAVDEFHRIEAIKSNTLVFREPIHHGIDSTHGWTIQRYEPLTEVGVEGLSLVGNWKERFKHHKNAIHDGGWSFLSLSRCANSWVRDCRFVDVNRACSISGSAAVTVEDVVIEGNPGHNAITINSASHCLVQRVIDRAGQWHACGVAGKASGNVFLHCEYTADTCYESHASQPRWTLFDNIRGGWKYGRWGGAESSLPNHLHGLVLWNYCNTGSGEPGRFQFMRTKGKHGRTIMPYVIGFHGRTQAWDEAQVALLESNGSPVLPQSLYEAQMSLRHSLKD